jgi:hypothetical protein
MSLKIDLPHPDILKPRITIFGVGGAGGNAINNMIRSQLEGVEFVAANTDSQALQHSLAKNKIQLGIKTTKGLGAGSFPDRGKAAAEENVEEIEKYVEGNNMIFIAAGMGGGTGTGAVEPPRGRLRCGVPAFIRGLAGHLIHPSRSARRIVGKGPERAFPFRVVWSGARRPAGCRSASPLLFWERLCKFAYRECRHRHIHSSHDGDWIFRYTSSYKR